MASGPRTIDEFDEEDFTILENLEDMDVDSLDDNYIEGPEESYDDEYADRGDDPYGTYEGIPDEVGMDY